eukprot:TRINITY_DN123699_c0_g1_i1.p1 TRINITY_DN123699_c0_g1~~TRINITY_DN123699_c0_g1_i1.p1  ORF type:complete len:358 (-),score=83.04 TRINITY_DN123699_c0_g1_i1:55-1128(-)
MAFRDASAVFIVVALLSLVTSCLGSSSAGPTMRAAEVAPARDTLQEVQRQFILMADDESADQEDYDSDEVVFMSFGTELHQAGKQAWPGAVEVPPAAASTMPKLPKASLGELAVWEDLFQRGLQQSEHIIGESQVADDEWVMSTDSSGAVVPRSMLDSEELLKQAVEAAPAEHRKAKLAERAHRLYHHAKWLAERSYARAAEWRYRLAATLATKSRRSVLAAHALSRLGYYLIQWRRLDEAQQVLKESRRLNGNSNNLASYLYGVLERKAAGGDEQRLREAEMLIRASGEQPSEELEVERQLLLQDISYWREAEQAVSNCLQHTDVANILICLCAHGGAAVKAAIDGAMVSEATAEL